MSTTAVPADQPSTPAATPASRGDASTLVQATEAAVAPAPKLKATPKAAPTAAPTAKTSAKTTTRRARQPAAQAAAPAARSVDTPQPAAKPAPKTRAKPVVKAAAAQAAAAPAPTGQPPQEGKAAKLVKPPKATKVTKATKAAKPAKPAKPPKLRQRPVRDSFTMPEADFGLIATLKARALAGQRETKKSELLRAGLHALAALDTPALLKALGQLEPVKIGRPAKGQAG